ncbi:hypothetical protein [Variovorax ginsengisoli]|uniref:Uncharacterized protein n=1 Tax=Variovorax ginsengisoli TaxID=363844 RepID=A0ABT8SDK5_9BURK|nr:hypothetical protein [Variovorax ginsengisoli]MDN8617840.1 hypothetical protein [Variovorax ginsengisoli]MDO1537010.1 hypothetical protein [Variovorax ginsengisoli]
MIYIGIDPGLSGAISFVSERSCIVEDLPTMPLPGTGLITKKIDGRALAQLIRKNVPIGETAEAYVEQVSTMGGKDNALQTQGSLMRSLGAIETVLECMGYRPTMLSPQKWKRFYGLDSDKKRSLATARALYEAAPLSLAKHHNRAEAVLIGHWGLRNKA